MARRPAARGVLVCWSWQPAGSGGGGARGRRSGHPVPTAEYGAARVRGAPPVAASSLEGVAARPGCRLISRSVERRTAAPPGRSRGVAGAAVRLTGPSGPPPPPPSVPSQPGPCVRLAPLRLVATGRPPPPAAAAAPAMPKLGSPRRRRRRRVERESGRPASSQ